MYAPVKLHTYCNRMTMTRRDLETRAQETSRYVHRYRHCRLYAHNQEEIFDLVYSTSQGNIFTVATVDRQFADSSSPPASHHRRPSRITPIQAVTPCYLHVTPDVKHAPQKHVSKHSSYIATYRPSDCHRCIISKRHSSQTLLTAVLQWSLDSDCKTIRFQVKPYRSRIQSIYNRFDFLCTIRRKGVRP